MAEFYDYFERDSEVIAEINTGYRPQLIVMDGIEATRAIIAEPSPPKVVVLTTFDADDLEGIRFNQIVAEIERSGFEIVKARKHEDAEIAVQTDAAIGCMVVDWGKKGLEGKTIVLGSAGWQSICDPMLKAAGVDITKVKVATAAADPAYVNGLLGAQITGGSTAIRSPACRCRSSRSACRSFSPRIR